MIIYIFSCMIDRKSFNRAMFMFGHAYYSIFIMFCTLFWKHVQSSQSDHSSLNSFLYDYAFQTMPKPRTGKLYDVSLPLNLSGIQVSIIRLRTHSLWKNGANLNSIEIPPKILPSPFTKRVDFVYQNLGNWSASYYNVPNYTFLAPIIGFLAYDSSTRLLNHRPIELNVRGDSPVIIRFNNISIDQEGEDVRMKCVRFSTNGTLEFSRVAAKSSCLTTNQGHFSIVVERRSRNDEKKRVVLKWWMVGIPTGIVGLVLVVFVGFMLFKCVRVRKMEKQSEISEGLDTVWIGSSRMPSASGLRTQPVLENSYFP